MSVSVTIRNLSNNAHAELRSRAAREGQSLQEYLRAHLERLASKPDMKTLMAQVEERLRQTGTNVDVETILADLDADRK